MITYLVLPFPYLYLRASLRKAPSIRWGTDPPAPPRREQDLKEESSVLLLINTHRRRRRKQTTTMADSTDQTNKYDHTPALGTSSLTTIAEASVIDSEVQTTKRKIIWNKSPEEVEDEVETLIKSRGDNCPERKRRHDEFNKEWDADEESLDKKQTCSKRSVAPEIIASLQKAKEGFAQLSELHNQIGESMEKFTSASTR